MYSSSVWRWDGVMMPVSGSVDSGMVMVSNMGSRVVGSWTNLL